MTYPGRLAPQRKQHANGIVSHLHDTTILRVFMPSVSAYELYLTTIKARQGQSNDLARMQFKGLLCHENVTVHFVGVW